MRKIDPKLELKPSDFQTPYAQCFDMYFTGIGKSRIHAKLIKPRKPAKKHPAVLMFHGYSGNAGDWSDKLGYAALGYTVAALDCRGQGGQSEDLGGATGHTLKGHIIRGLDDKPENMLFRKIYLDTAQMAQIVMDMPDVDPERVGATGGSQGGGLTLACASLEPRIKRVAPVFPFLCDYKRVWEMDLAKDAYDELRDYFRRFDPCHQREDEIFTKLGYVDVQHLVQRIRGEVLMAVGFMDTICPPSTQFAAYNKITSKKSLAIYPDFGHEGLPGMPDKVFQFMAGL
jgi:cephalosporin-C deacetylase